MYIYNEPQTTHWIHSLKDAIKILTVTKTSDLNGSCLSASEAIAAKSAKRCQLSLLLISQHWNDYNLLI